MLSPNPVLKVGVPMSFRRNHVPPTVEEIADLVAHPPVLLSKIELRMAVYDTQVRAELWQWEPERSWPSHLVWQHAAPIPCGTDSSVVLATHYLGETAEYLTAHRFPGVRF